MRFPNYIEYIDTKDYIEPDDMLFTNCRNNILTQQCPRSVQGPLGTIPDLSGPISDPFWQEIGQSIIIMTIPMKLRMLDKCPIWVLCRVNFVLLRLHFILELSLFMLREHDEFTHKRAWWQVATAPEHLEFIDLSTQGSPPSWCQISYQMGAAHTNRDVIEEYLNRDFYLYFPCIFRILLRNGSGRLQMKL